MSNVKKWDRKSLEELFNMRDQLATTKVPQVESRTNRFWPIIQVDMLYANPDDIRTQNPEWDVVYPKKRVISLFKTEVVYLEKGEKKRTFRCIEKYGWFEQVKVPRLKISIDYPAVLGLFKMLELGQSFLFNSSSVLRLGAVLFAYLTGSKNDSVTQELSSFLYDILQITDDNVISVEDNEYVIRVPIS